MSLDTSHISLSHNGKRRDLTIAHGFLLMVRCHGYDSRHISSVLSSPDQHGDGKTRLNEKFGY